MIDIKTRQTHWPPLLDLFIDDETTRRDGK
jgi:hypothetical protein